jgi:hypothetical protein
MTRVLHFQGVLANHTLYAKQGLQIVALVMADSNMQSAHAICLHASSMTHRSLMLMH